MVITIIKYVYKDVFDETEDLIKYIPGIKLIDAVTFSDNNYIEFEDVALKFPDILDSSFTRNVNLLSFIQSLDELPIVPETGSVFYDPNFFMNHIIENYKGKKILILGDFDVDGIMSTLIIDESLRLAGLDVEYMIPDRIIDKFGLKMKHVDYAIENNISLIITVDNGIAAIDEVVHARKNGIDVIVTDHHLPDGDIPNGNYVINPHLTTRKHVYPDICGAQVVLTLTLPFLLNEFRNNRVNIRTLEKLVVFAGIATVADMMPLLYDNRLLVKFTIDILERERVAKNPYSPLFKMMKGLMKNLNKYEDNNITSSTIGFSLAPSINAAGRMDGDVNNVIDDFKRLDEITFQLDGYISRNNERKDLTNHIMEVISGKFVDYYGNVSVNQITEDPVKFIILNQEELAMQRLEGVIGLVANQILTRYNTPVFVGLRNDNGSISFSGRSPAGYSIFEGFQRIKDLGFNIEGGGHDAAMGMTVLNSDELNDIWNEFNQDFVNNSNISEKIVYRITDANIQQYIKGVNPSKYIMDNLLDLDSFYYNNLKPFGQGLKVPKFVVRGFVNKENNWNIKFLDASSNQTYQFLIFNMDELFPDPNTFFGNEEVTLVIEIDGESKKIQVKDRIWSD